MSSLLPKKSMKKKRQSKTPKKKAKLRASSISSSDFSVLDDSFCPSSTCKLVEIYYQEMEGFQKEGLSYQTQKLVHSIVNSSHAPCDLKKTEFFSLVNQVIIEFMLNEIEIVIFNILLEKFGWQDKNAHFPTLLKYIGYSVKKGYSESINVLTAYIAETYPNFTDSFTP